MFESEQWSSALWPEENSAIDVLFSRRRADGSDEYEFVQLKEWAADELNPQQSLQEVLDRLSQRYADMGGLMIGLHVSRGAMTQIAELRIPCLNGASLWFFGIGGEPYDSILIGDLLWPDWVACSFAHPRFRVGESPTAWGDLLDD